MFSPTDTIVSVATPPGPGGIGVVRISGTRAREVVGTLLAGPRELVPRHATLTRVLGPDGRPQDEALVTLFPAPHSYTTEDVVEISAHGSPTLLREIVRGAMQAGARLAEPGEFTFRAFLNGRIDLVQAEAVADLVDAVTPLQARVAFDQLEGTLTHAIGKLDAELFDLAARLEASLDFPDEGYHFVQHEDTRETLQRVHDGIGTLLVSARQGRMIREGRQLAILGKPNVGKSSLFNWLVGAERAIVAELPGTTRDLVTETIDFDGIRLRLVDTAGLRVGEDVVEREGISRARAAAGVADLVLAVFDLSRPFDAEDETVLADTAAATRVVVWNKCDLTSRFGIRNAQCGIRDSRFGIRNSLDAEATSRSGPAGPGNGAPSVRSPGPFRLRAKRYGETSTKLEERSRAGPGNVVISLKTGEGLADLRAAMRNALEGGTTPLRDAPMVTNLRHETLLRQAQDALARAIAGLDERGPETAEELVLADIAGARSAFECVTGKRTSEDVLHQIFARFCIGK